MKILDKLTKKLVLRTIEEAKLTNKKHLLVFERPMFTLSLSERLKLDAVSRLMRDGSVVMSVRQNVRIAWAYGKMMLGIKILQMILAYKLRKDLKGEGA